MLPEQLQATIADWTAHDLDEATATRLSSLYDKVEAANPDAIAPLEDRPAGLLEFGATGFCGVVAASQFRMNHAAVIRVTAGLVAHLKNIVGDDFTVITGYGTHHGSVDFHRNAATVVATTDSKALVLPRQLPTPVIVFVVCHLNADAGIMVTASHNPPRDNGYKIYLGGYMVESGPRRGIQIIAPHDKQVCFLYVSPSP